MTKLLLLAVAIAVIYLAVKGFARKRREKASARPSELMVPCAHCGVNLPRSEAVEAAGRLYYCSEEHERRGPG